MKPFKVGEYVMATKYHDGYSGDHFCVGFYNGSYLSNSGIRHLVSDHDGNNFRHNGFRRCQRISDKRGKWVVDHMKEIEAAHCNVWRWYYCSEKDLNVA